MELWLQRVKLDYATSSKITWLGIALTIKVTTIIYQNFNKSTKNIWHALNLCALKLNRNSFQVRINFYLGIRLRWSIMSFIRNCFQLWYFQGKGAKTNFLVKKSKLIVMINSHIWKYGIKQCRKRRHAKLEQTNS
jgi:hypothetical protein